MSVPMHPSFMSAFGILHFAYSGSVYCWLKCYNWKLMMFYSASTISLLHNNTWKLDTSDFPAVVYWWLNGRLEFFGFVWWCCCLLMCVWFLHMNKTYKRMYLMIEIQYIVTPSRFYLLFQRGRSYLLASAYPWFD